MLCKSQQKMLEMNAKLDNAYKEGKREGYREGAVEAINLLYYMSAYTINLKLGFGKKRLQRIMDEILFQIDAYRTDHLNKMDYSNIIDEMNKMGIDLNNKRK